MKKTDPAFLEREISVTFENGGGLEITVRGESIVGVLEILLKLVVVVELNPNFMTDLTLRYWHLTKNLEQVNAEGYVSRVGNSNGDLQRKVSRMAATAKSRLLKDLARHHITLRGEKGEI